MRNPKAGVRDMILSMAVLLLPAIVLYYFFASSPDEPPVQSVDWKPVVSQARSAADYPVLAPADLDSAWTVNKARWAAKGTALTANRMAVGNTWQFGALGPDKVYYEITQRDEQTRALAGEGSRQGYEDGVSRIDGVDWLRFTSPDERTRCLARAEASHATTICADTSYASLDAFASQLVGG